MGLKITIYLCLFILFITPLYFFVLLLNTNCCRNRVSTIKEDLQSWTLILILFLDQGVEIRIFFLLPYPIVFYWNSNSKMFNWSSNWMLARPWFNPHLGREEKITSVFHLTLLCGPSNGFMKILNAFIKPFEAPQKSVKIKY